MLTTSKASIHPVVSHRHSAAAFVSYHDIVGTEMLDMPLRGGLSSFPNPSLQHTRSLLVEKSGVLSGRLLRTVE